MIPTYTLKAQFAVWWKCSLLFITLSTIAGADEQLSLHFLEPSTAATYFEDDSDNFRVVTTAETLEVVGQSSEGGMGMVVFGVNGRESPKYIKNGEFKTKIDLLNGSNRISATLPTGFAKTVNYEVIRLTPGEVSQINLKSEGSEDEVRTPTLGESGEIESQTVKVPQIRIAGKQAALAGFEMKVKDSQGNPVVIDPDGAQFFVDYTLTEGVNTLTFQSTFENKVFHEESMEITLEDVLAVTLDDTQNTTGFVERGETENSFICLKTEFPMKGYIEAVANGSVILTVGDSVQPLEVTNHEFQATIPLAPDALTTAKVSLDIEGQVYFDFIEIQQTRPSIEIVSIEEGMLNGAAIQTGDEVGSDEDSHYFTDNPIVNIVAKLDHMGALTGAIVNLTTNEVFPIKNEDGQFSKIVYLAEGDNTLKFRVGDTDKALDIDLCVVRVVSPLIFETVNDTPVDSETVNLSGNRCALYGIVNSIVRGFMVLKVDGNERTIPVIEGYFETESPLVLSPGEHNIEASIKINNRIFKNSLVVVAEDVPEEDTIVGEEVIAAEDDIIMQHDRQATTSFSPPVPRRMPSPGRVYDRVNNIQAVGEVTVQFVIGKNGKIDYDTVTIIDSTNPILNREAKRSVTRWRFHPATDATGPIDKTTRVTFTWK